MPFYRVGLEVPLFGASIVFVPTDKIVPVLDGRARIGDFTVSEYALIRHGRSALAVERNCKFRLFELGVRIIVVASAARRKRADRCRATKRKQQCY